MSVSRGKLKPIYFNFFLQRITDALLLISVTSRLYYNRFLCHCTDTHQFFCVVFFSFTRNPDIYTIGCFDRRSNVHLSWIAANNMPDVIADGCFNHLYFSVQCIFC